MDIERIWRARPPLAWDAPNDLQHSDARDNLKNQVEDKLRTPQSSLELPHLLARALANRGFSHQSEIHKLFNPSLRDLKDPLILDGMQKALERLVQARLKQERVAVYADFDLDGTSGLALLSKALKDFGFLNVELYQPLRLSEGYGLHKSAIDDLYKRGVRVIITVDVGITAIEAGQHAADLGIDLIITDHHLPKEKLPVAYSIINPNKGTCNSQLGHLSGAGVAFYLVLGLKRELEQRGILAKGYDPKNLLDCFVIGTLTDLVPLKGENRALVKHGLLQLQRTHRPGLKSLIERLGLQGRALSSQDVAITLAPKLNALSRMEMGLMPRDVLLVESVLEAQEMVERIIESNELRKYLQKEALQVALEMAKEQLSRPFVFVWSEGFHRGIIGLIATHLSKEFARPAFVGTLDENGIIHGSARSPEHGAFHLTDLLGSATSVLERFGGHKAAAGFSLKHEHADQFISLLGEHMSVMARITPITEYDVEAKLGELDSDFMSWYERLEPFGKDFPTFVFKLEGVLISELVELKGGHLRLSLQQGKSQTQAIYFNPDESSKALERGISVDALVEPQWNHFRGQKRLQIQIRDLLRRS